MIDKYFNGLIEQVCGRVGKTDRNIVMASYSNDFSVRTLESIVKHSEDEENVFFSWCEFDSDRLTGAYEPFLDVICNAYRKNGCLFLLFAVGVILYFAYNSLFVLCTDSFRVSYSVIEEVHKEHD